MAMVGAAGSALIKAKKEGAMTQEFGLMWAHIPQLSAVKKPASKPPAGKHVCQNIRRPVSVPRTSATKGIDTDAQNVQSSFTPQRRDSQTSEDRNDFRMTRPPSSESIAHCGVGSDDAGMLHSWEQLL